MASKTPSVVVENMGSLTAHIATFSDLDSGDNWNSNIPGIMLVIPATVDQALTPPGYTCSFTASDGTIWFTGVADSRACKFLVLSKS